FKSGLFYVHPPSIQLEVVELIDGAAAGGDALPRQHMLLPNFRKRKLNKQETKTNSATTSKSPKVKIFGKTTRTTTVTYGSYGQSVKPRGHVDNFFISGFAVNFLRIGILASAISIIATLMLDLHRLITRTNPILMEHCFKGANSAHKLPLSNKDIFQFVALDQQRY
ncbi:hypothetical protein EJB05_11867, partial [Eragrostis curvula]